MDNGFLNAIFPPPLGRWMAQVILQEARANGTHH
jgi:hypothetical protein